MKNTEDKKVQENMKSIPRNPNVPLQDEEIEEILKEAANKVDTIKTEDKKEPEKKENSESQKEQLKKEEKRDVVPDIPAFKKKDEKRENFDVKKESANQPETSVEKSVVLKETVSDKQQEKQIDKTNKDKKTQDKKTDGKVKEKAKEKTKEKTKEKVAESKKDLGDKEFKVEDDVYVTKQKEVSDSEAPAAPQKNYKMSVFEIIGSVLEGIWIGIKILIVVAIVTVIVGFFMSRDLMIRGRSGELLSKQGMNVAPLAHSTRLEERKEAKVWNENIKKEKLTMESDDGKILIAQKIIADSSSDKWVVILHGQNGSIEDIYDIGYFYTSEGYNVLMPNLRAHGESEGSYYGMGWLDRLDVINWIDVILAEHSAADIIIHGVDLGADAALMLSGEPLKDSIKVIIAEGAYTNAWDVVKNEYKLRHPKWPVFPVMHMLNPVAKVWGGYTLTEADAVEQVRKTKVPILLIHGGNDTYVTAEMTEELDAAIASEHEVLTIPAGTHEDCRYADPSTYYSKVLEFIGRYVP